MPVPCASATGQWRMNNTQMSLQKRGLVTSRWKHHIDTAQRSFSMVILNLVKVTVKINHNKDPITGPIKSLY